MAFSYQCNISFGLVFIPVRLVQAVRSREIGFNLLDKKTMSRVKYRKTCEACGGREIGQDDIVKGFEYADDQYVVFTEEDFDRLKTPRDRNITIEKFVDIDEIDPIYYDKPYYVNPAGAETAYALLLRAMEEEKKVGISKAVLGTKETLIALRPKDGHLLANTLFFADEVQKNPAGDVKTGLKESELNLAKSIVRGMSGTFEAEEYRDEYRERVRAAIERKIAGREIVSPQGESADPAAELMEALQASLNNLKPAARAARSKKSAGAKRA